MPSSASDPRTGPPLYEPPPLGHTVLRYRDQEVGHHGPAGDGLADFVAPGRRVVEIPGRSWVASSPEECTYDSLSGQWLDAAGAVCDPLTSPDAGVVLVCPECGLDGT